MIPATMNSKQVQQSMTNREEIDKYFEDQAHFYLTKKKIETIDNFNGIFDFLNNEYQCEVYFEGRYYPTVFHASQAARSDQDHIRAKISHADSMQELYELATLIKDPTDWANKRLAMMEKIIRDKFRRHKDLREKLKRTGDRDLINSFADATPSNLFWGMVEGKGQNQLGIILKNVRYDIHLDRELPRWLGFTFDVQDDPNLCPIMSLEIIKDEKVVETTVLKNKFTYIMGQFKDNDVVMAHKSISRRYIINFHNAVGWKAIKIFS